MEGFWGSIMHEALRSSEFFPLSEFVPELYWECWGAPWLAGLSYQHLLSTGEPCPSKGPKFSLHCSLGTYCWCAGYVWPEYHVWKTELAELRAWVIMWCCCVEHGGSVCFWHPLLKPRQNYMVDASRDCLIWHRMKLSENKWFYFGCNNICVAEVVAVVWRSVSTCNLAPCYSS